MNDPLKLPAVLDFRTAASLRTDLLVRRGAPIAIDAGEVERLGGQCIQVLVSAQRTWTHDGIPFSFIGVSDEARRALGHVGLGSFFMETTAP